MDSNYFLPESQDFCRSLNEYCLSGLCNGKYIYKILWNVPHSLQQSGKTSRCCSRIDSRLDSALVSNVHNFNGVYFFSVNPIKFNCKTVLKTNTIRKYFNNSATYLDEELLTYDYSNQTGNLLSELSVGSGLEDRKVMYAYPYSDSDFSWLNKLYRTNRISEPVGFFKLC